MELTMRKRQAVTKEMALKYKRAKKKQKGAILDTLPELTGYNRSYAARMLRQRGRTIVVGRGVVNGVNVTLIEDERSEGRSGSGEGPTAKRSLSRCRRCG